MKDSGIEWIGEIPQEWKIARIKHVIDHSEFGIKIGPFGSTLANRTLISGPYNVYSQANLISNSFSDTNHYVDRDTFVDLRAYEVKPGDVCVSMMGTIGKCKVVPEGITEGIMDSHLIKIRLDETQIDPRFFEYVYDKDNSGVCFTQMKYEKKGTIMDGLNTAIVKNLIIPLPPLNDQIDISKYLDTKCTEIDALIAAKEKTNALLKERRQSIIYEAVTKGLDPTVPMKDSGVEWIGMIPVRWSVLRLRFIGSFQNGISKAGEFFGSGYPFISYSDVYKNEVLPSVPEGLVESTESERKLYSVEKGDVFFTRTSETKEEIGIVAVCKETIPNATFAGFLIRMRPTTDFVSTDYLRYYFSCGLQREYFAKEMTLVTRASLGQDLLKNMVVTIPSIAEQQEIVNHLDVQTHSIDSIIAKNDDSIQKLKEYRQSLIYEAVTGKIDIN